MRSSFLIQLNRGASVFGHRALPVGLGENCPCFSYTDRQVLNRLRCEPLSEFNLAQCGVCVVRRAFIITIDITLTAGIILFQISIAEHCPLATAPSALETTRTRR